MHHQLVERDRELAAIDKALAAARDGTGEAILVEGEAGIGKTALLGTAARIARESEMTVLTARATPIEEGVAYGVARQLFLPLLLEAADREAAMAFAAGDPYAQAVLFESVTLRAWRISIGGLA
jgi:predicted ATPase